jgi:hypothetical protein
MFYTYAYLRKDGTPYYIGKGKGRRAWKKHDSVRLPPDDRILILKDNLTEEEAFRHEVFMIDAFGRKDLGTGILRNQSPGGDAPPRFLGHTEASKRKISKTLMGVKKNPFTDTHRKNMSMAQKKCGNRPPPWVKPFAFLAPDGTLHRGTNITAFAKQHNLIPGALHDMRRGKQKQHRGWTCHTTQYETRRPERKRNFG